jgi:hypothetical protein
MANGAAVDTDVLLKAAAYRLAGELLSVFATRGTPAALALTHLIAGRQLIRKRGLQDKEGAAKELAALLAGLEWLEPDEGEIELAADLASAAQEQSLPLDTGEAQLTAIVVNRQLAVLVTGDKRALSALAKLVRDQPLRDSLIGRAACFEQVLASVAALVGEEELRRRICAEPNVDGAMRMACSCGRQDWEPGQFHEACTSFTGAVRLDIGNLLIEGSTFV